MAKYAIARKAPLTDLEKTVQVLIEEGFKPLGGVIAVPTGVKNIMGATYYFIQTLFKEDDNG